MTNFTARARYQEQGRKERWFFALSEIPTLLGVKHCDRYGS